MKEHVFIINVICFITAIVYADSRDLVNEFEIEDSNNDTEKNVTTHRNITNPKLLKLLSTEKPGKLSNESKIKDELTNETDPLLDDSSMYTESDLDETSSNEVAELDGPDTKEKEANINNETNKRKKENKKEEVSSVYTDSDLEATKSQDNNKKHGDDLDRDKRTAAWLLDVPHKRDLNDAEQEGSGEGSGQEANNIL